MTTSTSSDDLTAARFVDTSFRGARFVGCDLSGVVMRGVYFESADIDAPWLADGAVLLVNGVDVAPLVEAELDRRFPGRSQRRAEDPESLRAAWEVLQHTWAATLVRAAAMPPGTPDVSVDEEWSLAQTLRHLVFATDVWLGGAALRIEQPLHPLGLPGEGIDGDLVDLSVLVTDPPSYDEVLVAREGRVALVRDVLARITPEELDEVRASPWAPSRSETVRSCLQVVLEEEWEHLRFAVRDLDAIAARTDG